MKLVASLIVKDEIGRYLEPCVSSLLEFCDVVAIWDDNSGPATGDWLADHPDPRVLSSWGRPAPMFEHEGRARQRLLDWTLSLEPTHVLAIDADEFVSDGAAVRDACQTGVPVMSLEMLEVWKAFDECLCVRGDGGWRPHPVHALWRVPETLDGRWRIADRPLACGRVPTVVDQTWSVPSGAAIFHFGWANETERLARHERYAVADGGRFHQSQHLASILYPDPQVALNPFEWPAGLELRKDAILQRCQSQVAAA